jgi:hypothetical protein
VNFTSTLQLLEDALKLVHRARREAGHDQEMTTLNTNEFQKALDFLREIFEDRFMWDAKLKAAICDLNEKPDELSRARKNRIRSDRRSAFKAWKWTLMGNVHFFHAVMRNGIFQLCDQQDLATALLQAENSVDEHHAGEVAEAIKLVPNKEAVRAEAVRARQQVQKAKQLLKRQNSGAYLTQSQIALCIRLDSGELERIRNQKNQAYSHGKSVTNLSIEQEAVMRAFSFNQLETYFEQ